MLDRATPLDMLEAHKWFNIAAKLRMNEAIRLRNEVAAKIPSTIEALALCKMAERGQITGAVLDRPLALDNAVSRDAPPR